MAQPDYRFPVLTGKRIPGKHPRIAAWLYKIAYRIEALAAKWDNRYASPFYYELNDSDTVTWGPRYEEAE